MTKKVNLAGMLEGCEDVKSVFEQLRKEGLEVDVGVGFRQVLEVKDNYVIFDENPLLNRGQFIYDFNTGKVYQPREKS